MILTTLGLLVGHNDNEINHVDKLYPDDPTQRLHLQQRQGQQ